MPVANCYRQSTQSRRMTETRKGRTGIQTTKRQLDALRSGHDKVIAQSVILEEPNFVQLK